MWGGEFRSPSFLRERQVRASYESLTSVIPEAGLPEIFDLVGKSSYPESIGVGNG